MLFCLLVLILRLLLVSLVVVLMEDHLVRNINTHIFFIFYYSLSLPPSLLLSLKDTMVSVRENAVSSGQRIFFEDSDGNRTDNFETFLNFTTTNDDITRPIKIYVEVHVYIVCVCVCVCYIYSPLHQYILVVYSTNIYDFLIE